MPYGLYLSAAGAHAQSARMDVISHNLANVDTVGYKRDVAIFQAQFAEAIAKGQAVPGSGTVDDIGGGVSVQQTATDFSTGPLHATKNPADMAIRREGFFQVKRDDETLLTRAGDFRVTARGDLVTQQGYPVLNETGTPITLARADMPFDVSPSGEIRQGEDVQRLALVRPQSLGDLAKVGDNLFRPLANTEPVPAAERDVAGGYLEMSGTSPTNEMIDLIETSRAVEANVNMMQTQDQMLNGLFNRGLKT